MPTVAAVCAGGRPVICESCRSIASVVVFLDRHPAAIPRNLHRRIPDRPRLRRWNPPTHLIHGEKDMNRPVQSSESFRRGVEKCWRRCRAHRRRKPGPSRHPDAPNNSEDGHGILHHRTANGTREKQMEKITGPHQSLPQWTRSRLGSPS